MSRPPEPGLGRAPRLFELPPDTDLVAWLLSLTPEQRAAAVDLLGPVERDSLDRDWESWAHPGQHFPQRLADGSDWTTWVVKGGRSFGKTLTGSNWITAAVATGEQLHIALVGATLDEARRVMVEGKSGLLAVADAWIRDWRPSLRRLSFRTGAEAVLFSGASPDQLRGPEHHLAWCDELAKWEKPRESWEMLQFGLRLGAQPRALITTTPRPGPLLLEIMTEPTTIVTGGPSSANPHNSDAWRRAIYARYAGTRLGRQELDGELLPEAGALWSPELLERCRMQSVIAIEARQSTTAEGAETGLLRSARNDDQVSNPDPSNIWTRLVIAVDPPSGGGTCGIVACAKDSAGIAHVLSDHSVTGASPERWARAVADAVRIHSLSSPGFPGEGDRVGRGGGAPPLPRGVEVVAEQNQGGRMVAAVLRTADPKLRVKPVTATVGKAERAAPIAHLFEAGKVVLHGRFPELEAELLGMVFGGEYQGPGSSPDRADAMVWGLTELMLGKEKGEPRIRLL